MKLLTAQNAPNRSYLCTIFKLTLLPLIFLEILSSRLFSYIISTSKLKSYHMMKPLWRCDVGEHLSHGKYEDIR